MVGLLALIVTIYMILEVVKIKGVYMIIKYCTKRDINGNTYKLIIDTDGKIFARECSGFFHRSDFLEISKRDYRRLISETKENKYNEVNVI